MNLEKIVFTKHALERGKEMGMSEKRMRDLLGGTRRLKTNFLRDAYKLLKYGSKQSSVAYYYRKETARYLPLLFTIEEGEVSTVITITVKEGKV